MVKSPVPKPKRVKTAIALAMLSVHGGKVHTFHSNNSGTVLMGVERDLAEVTALIKKHGAFPAGPMASKLDHTIYTRWDGISLFLATKGVTGQ
jgi:hypothetical protein